MAFLDRSQVIRLAHEGTEGDSSTATFGTDVPTLFSASISPEVETFERDPFGSSWGDKAPLAGMRTASLQFQTELVGSGDATDYPIWSEYMESCGFLPYRYTSFGCGSLAADIAAGTVLTDGTDTIVVLEDAASGATNITGARVKGTAANTATLTGCDANGNELTAGSVVLTTAPATEKLCWLPVSTLGVTAGTARSASIEHHTGGDGTDSVLHTLSGARGSWSLSAASGDSIKIDFNFTGKWESTEAGTVPSVSYCDRIPPQFLSVGLELGNNTDFVFDSLSMDFGNDIQYRKNANSADGVESTVITNRSVTANIDPELKAYNTDHLFKSLRDVSSAKMSLTVGSSTGNQFKIVAPAAIASQVGQGERNGVAINDASLSLTDFGGGNNGVFIMAI